jgi:hypothetical protein
VWQWDREVGVWVWVWNGNQALYSCYANDQLVHRGERYEYGMGNPYCMYSEDFTEQYGREPSRTSGPTDPGFISPTFTPSTAHPRTHPPFWPIGGWNVVLPEGSTHYL